MKRYLAIFGLALAILALSCTLNLMPLSAETGTAETSLNGVLGGLLPALGGTPPETPPIPPNLVQNSPDSGLKHPDIWSGQADTLIWLGIAFLVVLLGTQVLAFLIDGYLAAIPALAPLISKLGTLSVAVVVSVLVGLAMRWPFKVFPLTYGLFLGFLGLLLAILFYNKFMKKKK